MRRSIFTLLLLSVVYTTVWAQDKDALPAISFKKGIGITSPDSSFTLNFRFRMQNRAVYNTVSEEDFSAADVEARVRRLRLRMDGYIFDPKLSYLIQLSFSRGDMDWAVRQNSAVNESPNLVRDAAVFYRPNKIFTVIFGQTKLPGNRQRVISSGDQQFMDRSIVNAAFNIDRDFGLQVHSFSHIGKFHYIAKAALTTGDGRNTTVTNSGLSYTGRIELLPLGLFTNNGDYFEGDLAREQTVKISIAGGINYNEKARRTGGQIGQDLYALRNISTYLLDGLLKYRGFSIYFEHINRGVSNPLTSNATGDIRYVLPGYGNLVQSAYLLKNNVEFAARFAQVKPGKEVGHLQAAEDVYTTGITKYLRAHKLKIQGNVSLHNLGSTPKSNERTFWSIGTQIELGI